MSLIPDGILLRKSTFGDRLITRGNDLPGFFHRFIEIRNDENPAVPCFEIPVLMVELQGESLPAIDSFYLGKNVIAASGIPRSKRSELTGCIRSPGSIQRCIFIS